MHTNGTHVLHLYTHVFEQKKGTKGRYHMQFKKKHSTVTYGLELLVKRMYKGISIKMKGHQTTCTYTLDSHVHKNQETMSKRDI